MLITIDKLKELNACAEVLIFFNDRYCEIKAFDLIFDLIKLDEIEKYKWANWLMSKSLTKENKIKYIIFSAELVLHIFENKYYNDKRPRNAIDAAKEYLNKKNATITASADAAAAACKETYKKILNYGLELLDGRMKELKNYVCTLEQGKKLEELSVGHNSLFYWIYNGKSGYSNLKLNIEIDKKNNFAIKEKINDDGWIDYKVCPAFTSQELIEIIVNINDCALESYFNDVVYIKGENEAKERAQFLIDYLEMLKKEEGTQDEI